MSDSRLKSIQDKEEAIKKACQEAWYGSGTFDHVFQLEEEIRKLKNENCLSTNQYDSGRRRV